MNSFERNSLLESYGNAHEVLIAALKEFPKEMWKWKPAPEKWSIHEIIIHLADSEANSFARGRKIVAEPGSMILAYDQDAWAVKTLYHEQDPELALELFRLLRKSSYEMIKNLPDDAWESAATHSESGRYTFGHWLKIYD